MQWEKLSETIQIAIDDAHRFGTDAFLLEHFAAVRGTVHRTPKNRKNRKDGISHVTGIREHTRARSGTVVR